LTVEINAPGVTVGTAELMLVRSQGAATWTIPAVRGGDGTFTARVPFDDTPDPLTSSDFLAAGNRLTAGNPLAPGTVSTSGNTPTPGEWDVYLKPDGKPRIRIAWPDGMAEGRRLLDDREVVVGRSRYGDLVMAERTPRPVIESYSWQPEGRLELRGSFLGASSGALEGDYEIQFRRVGSGDAHVLPLQLRGERFTLIADVERMPFFGTGIPLRDGEWKLYVRPVGSAGELAELNEAGCRRAQAVPAHRHRAR
jgi:hypothetical protein